MRNVQVKHTVARRDTSCQIFVAERGRDACAKQDKQVMSFFQVDGPHLDPPVTDRIVLNHYFSKSWTEVLQKIRRGSGDGGGRTWAYMVDFEKEAVLTCEPQASH